MPGRRELTIRATITFLAWFIIFWPLGVPLGFMTGAWWAWPAAAALFAAGTFAWDARREDRAQRAARRAATRVSAPARAGIEAGDEKLSG